MFGAIAGGIASALAGGAMSKLFGGGQKAASGGIQGDVLATDNNTVGMGDAGIKSAIQGSNEIGRAVQQECRDRSRMPSSACKKKLLSSETKPYHKPCLLQLLSQCQT